MMTKKTEKCPVWISLNKKKQKQYINLATRLVWLLQSFGDKMQQLLKTLFFTFKPLRKRWLSQEVFEHSDDRRPLK